MCATRRASPLCGAGDFGGMEAMVKEITLRQVGGSVGATLPKDMADRLHLGPGDRVLAVETERGILLSPYDPTVEEALAIAARAAKKYRSALRTLAR
jgi:putative addiction module antidote